MKAIEEHKSGRIFCGKELRYIAEPEEMRCIFCNKVFKSQAICSTRRKTRYAPIR